MSSVKRPAPRLLPQTRSRCARRGRPPADPQPATRRQRVDGGESDRAGSRRHSSHRLRVRCRTHLHGAWCCHCGRAVHRHRPGGYRRNDRARLRRLEAAAFRYASPSKAHGSNKLNEQLVEALSMLSNSLKSGFGLMQSLDLLAERDGAPVRDRDPPHAARHQRRPDIRRRSAGDGQALRQPRPRHRRYGDADPAIDRR